MKVLKEITVIILCSVLTAILCFFLDLTHRDNELSFKETVYALSGFSVILTVVAIPVYYYLKKKQLKK